MLTNQILPKTNWCSFFSNQLIKIQNKPLSIKIAIAVVAIFACFTIAYGCYIRMSALRNRVSSQRASNRVLNYIMGENGGTPTILPREQCQAAIRCNNAAWVQLQSNGNPGSFILNVLPRLPIDAEQVPYNRFLTNGDSSNIQWIKVSDARLAIQNREWISIDEFARLTGLQR